MEPQRPNAPDSGETATGAADETLRRLEERLDRASAAAERLVAEAGRSVRAAPPPGDQASASPDPPPAGWQIPSSEHERRPDGDLELLLELIGGLRDLLPPDLQRRLAEALRELLLAIRALIDWYLERDEERRPAGAELKDIPII